MTSKRIEIRKRDATSVSQEDLFSNEGAPVSSRSARYKRRAKNGKLATLAALLSLCILGGTTFYFTSEAYAANTARQTYLHEKSRHKVLVQKIETRKTEASQLMTNCAASVSDTDLCVQLDSALDVAEKVDTSECAKIDPYEVPTKVVTEETECLVSKNDRMEEACKALEGKMKPVHEAVATKSIEDYEKTLKEADTLLQESRTLVSETEGEVVNEFTRRQVSDGANALEKKLKEIRGQGDTAFRDYTAVTKEVSQLIDALRSAMDALNQDHDQWVQDQELAQARAEGAQQNPQGGEEQNQPGQPQGNPGNGVNPNPNPNEGVPNVE